MCFKLWILMTIFNFRMEFVIYWRILSVGMTTNEYSMVIPMLNFNRRHSMLNKNDLNYNKVFVVASMEIYLSNSKIYSQFSLVSVTFGNEYFWNWTFLFPSTLYYYQWFRYEKFKMFSYGNCHWFLAQKTQKGLILGSVRGLQLSGDHMKLATFKLLESTVSSRNSNFKIYFI